MSNEADPIRVAQEALWNGYIDQQKNAIQRVQDTQLKDKLDNSNTELKRLPTKEMQRTFVTKSGMESVGIAKSDASSGNGGGGSVTQQTQIPERPSAGTFILASVDGVLKWFETESCEQ